MKDFLVHLLLPHSTNNHRPKVLHIDSLFVYVVFFLVLNIGVRIIHQSSPQILGYATDIYIDQLLTVTNAKRAELGLGALALNETLNQAAALKAQHMITHNYWAHNSPDGKTPWEFITQAGYKYRIAGENLAKNFNNSQSVVDAWMASPTHKDNIIKPTYHDIGFAVINGIINGEETTLVVQMFGSLANTGFARSVPTEISPEAAASDVTAVQSKIETQNKQELIANKPQNPLNALPAAPVYASNGVASAFSGVSLKPAVDLTKFTKDTAYIFIGFLVMILALDAYIITHKRIIRVAGHNFAHILFLGSLTIALIFTMPGTII